MLVKKSPLNSHLQRPEVVVDLHEVEQLEEGAHGRPGVQALGKQRGVVAPPHVAGQVAVAVTQHLNLGPRPAQKRHPEQRQRHHIKPGGNGRMDGWRNERMKVFRL